jgi:hypothetical protein
LPVLSTVNLKVIKSVVLPFGTVISKYLVPLEGATNFTPWMYFVVLVVELEAVILVLLPS